MKTKTLISLAVLTLAFTVVLVAQQQTSGQAKPAATAEPDPAIISKLEEIIAILDGQFKNYEIQFQAGRAPADGLAEIDLTEARIRLASERNQKEAVIAELKKLVAAHERRIKRIQPLLLDRMPRGEMDKYRVALLEAEIRLLKAQR